MILLAVIVMGQGWQAIPERTGHGTEDESDA